MAGIDFCNYIDCSLEVQNPLFYALNYPIDLVKTTFSFQPKPET